MMEAVFTVQRPIGLASALVLDSPHSRKTFPDDFGAAVTIAQLRTAGDLFVNELWSRAPDHGAALLEAQFPRSYIDPNRGAGDIDLELLEGGGLITTNPAERGAWVRRGTCPHVFGA